MKSSGAVRSRFRFLSDAILSESDERRNTRGDETEAATFAAERQQVPGPASSAPKVVQCAGLKPIVPSLSRLSVQIFIYDFWIQYDATTRPVDGNGVFITQPIIVTVNE